METVKTGHSVTPSVAPTTPSDGPANAAPANSALVTVPLFGGLRGGRQRKDGLTPGSPEADAADRERDRQRKQKLRDAAKPPEPAPLPPAPVAGPAPAPAPDAIAQPGLAPVPFVPWDQATLKPLFDQLIPTIEELTVDQMTSRAEKAKLSPEMVKEIGKDARWSSPSRKAVEIAAPQVAAKWMNKAGISAENQPEIVLGTAVVSIVAVHVKLIRKLDKIIAQREAAAAPSDNRNHKPVNP